MEKNTASRISPAKVLLTLANLLVIAFIFYNSSRAGQASASLSQGVMQWVNGALSGVGIPVQLSHLTIRKLGHLAEFMLLGFWLLLWLRVYTRRLFAFIAWPLFGGLFIACTDEFIQRFVPDRTSSVTDVLLDFAGVLAGMAAALVLVCILQAVRKNKKSAQPPPA